MLIPYVEQIHLGVFIPNRKLHTQPMKQLEKYLKGKGYTLYYFEDAYREEISVDNWPYVDVIITFFSEGIDFLKVRKYANIHKPIEINKIDEQFLLLDRRIVMAVLDQIGVPTAERLVYNGRVKEKEINAENKEKKKKEEESKGVSARKKGAQKKSRQYEGIVSTSSILDKIVKDGVFDAASEAGKEEELKKSSVEQDSVEKAYPKYKKDVEVEIDRIIKTQLSLFNIKRNELFKPSEKRVCEGDKLWIGDKSINKPYIEKPAYSEDHNIHVYYSKYCKGREQGICRLFRKIGSKSSNYDKNPSKISYREDGSYIYEKLIEVKNYLDIKVYVMGKTVYAETRKCPERDGIVIRTKSGKEERKEIKLTKNEIRAVQKTSKSFGQFICGMDILRAANGGFILVDVNGWSFVKSNLQYYTQKNLKYLDKKIKKEVLKKRAKSGDSTRRKDVSLYKEIIQIIHRDAEKQPVEKNKRKEYGADAETEKNQESKKMTECIEIKGIHTVYRHARRTPKLKKRLVFVSEYLIEYISRTCNMAGRDTSKVKEIQEILEREEKEKIQFRTKENLASLESLKKIAEINSGVRVKILKEEKSVRLVLKWGGLLTNRAKKEIEYEAMEYESFLSTVQGDSFSTYDLYSPTKPTSSLKTARKIRLFANPEDRTQKTAEVFKSVLEWAGRCNTPVKEKYFSILRETEPTPDKICPELTSAYMALKESLLVKNKSSDALKEERSLDNETAHKCNDGSADTDTLCMNRLSIKKEHGSPAPTSSLCDCLASLSCECRETYFLKRWCFVFEEYPTLTHKNAKTVIPLLIDLIKYDILSSQYEKAIPPIFQYFQNIEKLYQLFNTHACFLYRNRIDIFFRKNKMLDIIKYLYSRFDSHSDTIYFTKKFTILLLLQYILSIKETVYINTELKKEIENKMHGIGFLSSIVMVHLSCKDIEYVLVRYSHGIHIDNKILKRGVIRRNDEEPEQILRTDRHKILCIVRKSVLFKNYEKSQNE
ncbi:inositol-hexakisphosphate/diphosphoinositol-pentakisphosphate 1-kinase [Nematocida parisii]|nr:uncharacterized protein NEPG_02424 [Nematocida parisii ERTm1]EIJ92733.1 hypothetical protein NEPG_02424 [Nematocida parisii ERTm1]KAI5143049.1 inositol-hexakisphosphate/diphosphoinositol-pentakisphosphate 1-kinase [Nematocida parisii]KAI5153722.1 inositol-hexakisphosphate/diphosphoinositol-pentakisphosphate 1-kinase [Nematocida parisii]KAI5156165.1 inositol-hexakisphosphate/diphosphoinositol-pentakisphosphate 1-kinase [Nematocida parisii]|eukprot:XP_013060251.1 hypothetical protein NEPG_02424 [Nematocida parisii ERTm1]